jgi:UDP-3-O-[3-hydroxymyristoyl] glucosamine N-acyltransferase
MIHPTAFISADAILGEACQVLAFGHVGTRCRLAEGVIINTRASVDHECILGNGVHIAPGAVLAGRVTVGDNTMICTYVGSPVRRVK